MLGLGEPVNTLAGVSQAVQGGGGAGPTKPKRSDIPIQCGTDTSDHILSYDSGTGHGRHRETGE